MESRGRGKRQSTIVTAPASSSTTASETTAIVTSGNVEKKKPGRKSLAVTARKRSPSPPAPKRKPSPARKASPARRASPTRKASPARKSSPARKASLGRKPKAAPTVITDNVPKKSVPGTEKVSPEEPRRSERIRASEEIGDPVVSSLAKKYPVDKRLSVIIDDVEVSGFMTAKNVSPGKSLTPNTSRRSTAITPTTTERSRATLSRSTSAALQDYSDHEDDADFQSFRRTTDNGVRDKIYARRSATKPYMQSRLVEFGGPLGAGLLLLIVPLFIFTTNHFCSGAAHRDCRFVLPKSLDEFSTLSTYMNKEIGAFYGLFVMGVALLSGIPIGKQVSLIDESYNKQSHTFTGLLVAFGSGVSVFVAEYCYKYPLLSVVSRGYNQLLVLSLLTALVVAMFALLKSRSHDELFWNPYAKTGNVLYDFFAGRETNPLVLNVFNLKLITYHVALVLALLFNSIILYRNLHFVALPEALLGAPVQERLLFAVTNLTCEPAPVAAAGLTILYLLDLLSYEHHLVASFELQQEGFGAQMLLRYATFPFALTLLPKYVAAHKFSDVPLWAVLVSVSIALVGLYVKRASLRIKYLYRLNPLGEKVACLETFPTYQGRRLLVAKLWRLVRQPNYTGDILQNMALLPLLYWRFAWPPLLAVLFTVGILVHRAKRLNERNARKYDSAWYRYCNTVPYMLVPRVY